MLVCKYYIGPIGHRPIGIYTYNDKNNQLDKAHYIRFISLLLCHYYAPLHLFILFYFNASF